MLLLLLLLLEPSMPNEQFLLQPWNFIFQYQALITFLSSLWPNLFDLPRVNRQDLKTSRAP